MPRTASLNVRIDPKAKIQAENLYSSFGISLSDAVNIFIYKSIQCCGLPFELRQGNPAINAMRRLSSAAKQNGTSDMSLDEINEEIEMVRNKNLLRAKL